MISALGATCKTIRYLKPDLWRGIDEQARRKCNETVRQGSETPPCCSRRRQITAFLFVFLLQIIEVKFEKFDVERDNYCRYDHVSIFNGAEINDAKRIGKYCGDSPPA